MSVVTIKYAPIGSSKDSPALGYDAASAGPNNGRKDASRSHGWSARGCGQRSWSQSPVFVALSARCIPASRRRGVHRAAHLSHSVMRQVQQCQPGPPSWCVPARHWRRRATMCGMCTAVHMPSRRRVIECPIRCRRTKQALARRLPRPAGRSACSFATGGRPWD